MFRLPAGPKYVVDTSTTHTSAVYFLWTIIIKVLQFRYPVIDNCTQIKVDIVGYFDDGFTRFKTVLCMHVVKKREAIDPLGDYRNF